MFIDGGILSSILVLVMVIGRDALKQQVVTPLCFICREAEVKSHKAKESGKILEGDGNSTTGRRSPQGEQMANLSAHKEEHLEVLLSVVIQSLCLHLELYLNQLFNL